MTYTQEQHVFEETSGFIAYMSFIITEKFTLTITLMFTRGNKLVFGPGLLGTLGLSIRRLRCRIILTKCIGEQHRKQRKMLNPVFSIAHMREMSESSFSS